MKAASCESNWRLRRFALVAIVGGLGAMGLSGLLLLVATYLEAANAARLLVGAKAAMAVGFAALGYGVFAIPRVRCPRCKGRWGMFDGQCRSCGLPKCAPDDPDKETP